MVFFSARGGFYGELGGFDCKVSGIFLGGAGGAFFSVAVDEVGVYLDSVGLRWIVWG